MTKVHHKTYAAAEAFAKRELGAEKVTVRTPTVLEHLQVKAKHLDNEKVLDSVVVGDAKGNEYLLGVVDDHHSKHLNHESAIATAVGLIPVVGPPLAATIAVKDIVKAGIPLVQAKYTGQATHPGDRALMRMGFKHLGLSAASMASHGAAHYVAMGVEVVAASKDLGDARPKWKDLPKSLWTAIKSLFSVKAHEDHGSHESLRVVLVKQVVVAPPLELEKGAGNPEETCGPPAVSPAKS